MKRTTWIRPLFLLAAVYDGGLGLLFAAWPQQVYQYFNVEPPNHLGYVQFPAGLLIIFALMFLAVAIRPLHNRNLIPYGILLKVVYCLIVFYYWFTIGVPSMWKPFALADVVWAVLFLAAFVKLGVLPQSSISATAARV